MTDIYSPPDANLTDRLTNFSGYGSIEDGVAGNYKFSIREIFSEAWGKVSGAKGTVWLAILFYVMAIIIFSIAANILSYIGGMILQSNDSALYKIFSNLIIQLAQLPISMTLYAGMFMISIKLAVGAPVQAKDVFAYLNKIVPLGLTTLLMYFLIFLGTLLFVFPGIYLAIAYSMAIPLVVDKNMTPWQALETSRKAITHHWFRMFGFFFLAVILIAISTLLLGIGLIWCFPLTSIAGGLIYRNMFGYSGAVAE